MSAERRSDADRQLRRTRSKGNDRQPDNHGTETQLQTDGRSAADHRFAAGVEQNAAEHDGDKLQDH